MQNTKTMRNYWRDREYRNRKKMEAEVLILLESLGGSSVSKSLSSDKIKCKKLLGSDKIT